MVYVCGITRSSNRLLMCEYCHVSLRSGLLSVQKIIVYLLFDLPELFLLMHKEAIILRGQLSF